MKKYEQPSMETIEFKNNDVVTTSELTWQEYEKSDSADWSEWVH
mgnify:CR=1 FL=1